MGRFLKSNKETIGLSPDAMHFIGEQKIEETRIRVIDYNAETLSEIEAKNINEIIDLDRPGTTSWLNIDGLHDVKIMNDLSSMFNISTLIFSDALDTNARPKLQEHDNCLFISTKMLLYNANEDEVSSENLVLILKENVLISFQERVGDVFNPVRERLRKNRKRIRCSGTDYLTFALLDIVIDNYIYIISKIGEKIESLDDELIKNPSTDNLGEINKYKGEINYLRKTIKPCRELILKFVKLDSEFIDDDMSIYLQELQNNIELANESLDSYREILSDQLNIFHSNVSSKLNDVLKVLTIFSVIFIPITFIAGVYGTNFDNIPELHYKYSYFIMWGVIVGVVITMVSFFKRKKWI